MGMSPVRCADEVLTFVSKWDIGSTGAHTKTAGFPGTGFSGVARADTGEYTVTFNKGMPIGPFLDLTINPFYTADTLPLKTTPVMSSFVKETAAAAATVEYEAWNASALTELASGTQVVITARFLKTK